MSWLKESISLVGSFLAAFKVTGKNLFKKPVTISYPDEKRVLPERQRATFALLTDPKTGDEKCTGCLICQNICPSFVIKMEKEIRNERGYAKTFTLDLSGCIFCELCVQACPQDAIVMVRHWEISDLKKENIILDKKALMENQKYPASIISGSKIREMQAVPKSKPPTS